VRRIAAVLSMLLGAIAGALLLKISLVPPLLAAAALALIAALAYVPARAGRRERGSQRFAVWRAGELQRGFLAEVGTAVVEGRVVVEVSEQSWASACRSSGVRGRLTPRGPKRRGVLPAS
jgi:membrane protein implicated in regulation of membrane protease activity